MSDGQVIDLLIQILVAADEYEWGAVPAISDRLTDAYLTDEQRSILARAVTQGHALYQFTGMDNR